MVVVKMVLGGGAIGVELAQVVRALRRRGDRARGGARLVGAGGARSRASCWPRCFACEGIGRAHAAVTVESVDHRRAGFTDRPARDGDAGGGRAAASWPPGGARDLGAARCGRYRSGRARPGRSPVDDHLRVGAPGIWARRRRHRARGRSPTSRCTRPDIVVNDILGPPGGARRLPGPAPGHLHRPGDRVGRPERDARPGTQGPRRCGWGWPTSRVDPGVDPQGRQRGVHQARRGRRAGGAGRGDVGRARGVARCSACWPWPSTPRCRPSGSAT